MDAVIKGYPYAKAAVEFAAYDLAAQRSACPGAHAARRRARSGCRSRIRSACSASRGRTRGGQGRRRRASARSRSRSASIRSATSRSCAPIRKARSGRTSDSASTRTRATDTGRGDPHLRAMETYGLKYAEQPVMGIERIAEVARAIDTPVMADESAWNAHDVIQIIEQGAVEIVSIYTTKPGGLYRRWKSRRCAAPRASLQRQRLGRDRRGQPRQHPARRRGAGSHALLRVRCRRPPRRSRGASAASTTGRPARRADALTDGAIEVPLAPGLGIEVDEAKIERYRVRS
jgi:muconate cycloisomerase